MNSKLNVYVNNQHVDSNLSKLALQSTRKWIETYQQHHTDPVIANNALTNAKLLVSHIIENLNPTIPPEQAELIFGMLVKFVIQNIDTLLTTNQYSYTVVSEMFEVLDNLIGKFD